MQPAHLNWSLLSARGTELSQFSGRLTKFAHSWAAATCAVDGNKLHLLENLITLSCNYGNRERRRIAQVHMAQVQMVLRWRALRKTAKLLQIELAALSLHITSHHM